MSATYSTNLALELIGTGDQAGNWGATNNLNIGTLLEQAISGYVTQAVSTGTVTTLTMSQGASATARNIYIELTGTGGTGTQLVVPANKKLYFIYNGTAGAVQVLVSGQTGISVTAGSKVILVCNGTDIVNAVSYSLPIAGALPVTDGGTGVSTLTGVAYGNGTSAFTAATGPQIATAIGTSVVTNSTNTVNLITANFSITQSGSSLVFKYGTTTIASMDSSGNLTTLGSVNAAGTP